MGNIPGFPDPNGHGGDDHLDRAYAAARSRIAGLRERDPRGANLTALERFELRSEETKDDDPDFTPEERDEYLRSHSFTEVERSATVHHGGDGDMGAALRRAHRQLEHRLSAPRPVARTPRVRRPRCRAARPRRSHVRSGCRTSRAGPSDDDGSEPAPGDGPANPNGGAR